MSTRSSLSAPNSGSAAKQSKYGWGGGSKLQGLARLVDQRYSSINPVRIHAIGTPRQRSTVFSVNMLGGVGAGKSQFPTSPTYGNYGGVRRFAPYHFWDFPNRR
jgi:hypothetical protein